MVGWRSIGLLAGGIALVTASAGAAPPPLSVYGNLPGIEMAEMSPSGERIAIVGRIGEKRRVVVSDSKGALLTAAELDDIKVRAIQWAGEQDVVIYRSDTFGMDPNITVTKAELLTGLVMPLDGRPAWKLFDASMRTTGTLNRRLGMRERDGNIYGYFASMTKEVGIGNQVYLATGRPDLYEVEMRTGKTRKIADHSETGSREWIVGADGKVAAHMDFNSVNSVWSVDNGDGRPIASGQNKLGMVDLIGFGPKPGTVIYSIGNPDDSSIAWYEASQAGAWNQPFLPDTNFERPVIDDETGAVVGYYRHGERASYHFFDPARQMAFEATLKAFPGGIVSLEDWNSDFTKLLVMIEDDQNPQSWFTVDLKARRANPVGTAYAVPADQIGRVRLIRYKAGDGLEIEAVLTLPPGRADKNLPVVVLPHGGPGAHDGTGFDWWAQAFASRGYAVLQPNFRGSTGYGAAFLRAGYGQWGKAMQTDVSDGLKYLADQGIVDASRACIMGAGYGGYVALAGVTLQQGLYRCSVSVAGVADVAALAATEKRQFDRNPTLMRALEQELGAGRDLKQVSPVNFADRADAPILLIHGVDDTVVLYKQSADMLAALRKAGKPAELVTLPGEDHWLSRGPTRLSMLEAAMAFVQKHNPADPMP